MNIDSIRLLIILSIILLASCSGKERCQVEFYHSKKGQIIVPLLINGVEIKGVFDTGAPNTYFIKSDLEKTKLPLLREKSRVWFPLLYDRPFDANRTEEVDVVIGKMKTPKKISIMSTTGIDKGMTVWGNDIIDQFCWLFDFNANTVTVSKDTIPITVNEFVRIPYHKNGNLNICSINLNGQTFDGLILDSGLIWAKHNGKEYSICLYLSERQNGKDSIGVAPQEKSLKFGKCNYSFPFLNDTINNTDIPIYCGLFALQNWNKENDLVYNPNGYISLCYGLGYSMMYLDTRNQIVYLKK